MASVILHSNTELAKGVPEVHHVFLTDSVALWYGPPYCNSTLKHLSVPQDSDAALDNAAFAFENVVFVALCSRAPKFGLGVAHPYPPGSEDGG